MKDFQPNSWPPMKPDDSIPISGIGGPSPDFGYHDDPPSGTESDWAAEHYRQQRVKRGRAWRIAGVVALVALVVAALLLVVSGAAAGVDPVRPMFLLGGEYPA